MQTFGMDRRTGKKISGTAHLAQSIGDILSTRKKTRVMLRRYGSNLPNIVDRPMNALFVGQFYAETVQALYEWEPRIQIKNVTADFSQMNQGRALLDMVAYYKPDGQLIRLNKIVVDLSR